MRLLLTAGDFLLLFANRRFFIFGLFLCSADHGVGFDLVLFHDHLAVLYSSSLGADVRWPVPFWNWRHFGSRPPRLTKRRIRNINFPYAIPRL